MNNDFLNFRDKSVRGWGYTVFGKVVEGMDVVDKIRKSPTGPSGPFRQDVPKTAVVIQSAALIQRIQRTRAQEMEFIDIVSDITSEIDLATLLHKVMREATRMLNRAGCG